jgi:hypothetical protein
MKREVGYVTTVGLTFAMRIHILGHITEYEGKAFV